MNNLITRMQDAQSLLAPYAVPIAGQLGRSLEEAPDATRFPFQRDRGRIVHSLAFRRLKGKTQVFVSGVGDHYRTRLTHTLEVSQIGRDIARTLRLNEDLAECIALAHDLGHPPFGHAGEEALDAWMKQHDSSFEHNHQSLRIVTTLETHSSLYKGLNVNIEVLEGLMKHRTPHDHPVIDLPRKPSLEAQVINLADEIAYTGHDCDDGLRAGLFSLDELKEIPLVQDSLAVSTARGTPVRGGIIHLLLTDLYKETEKQLQKQNVRTLEDVYTFAEDPVRFSVDMRTRMTELRSFLWKNMYYHPEVLKRTERGTDMVVSLCNRLLDAPTEKVHDLMYKHDANVYEAVKDYVAGMTDDYAEVMYNG